MQLNRYFEGNGDRKERAAPAFTPHPFIADAEGYVADADLQDAVNVALLLGQPLLLTGEPGTGKTLLARRLAWEFGQEPLVFIARTTATASELFYTFDALRRFLDAQVHAPEAREPERYVTYQALGKAILLALPPAMRGRFCPRDLRDAPPRRSVVLIDEIDKAPRDFPNDILNEIERLEFTVAEADERFPNFEAEQKRLVKEEGYSAESAAELVQSYVVEFQRNRPVLILTSNDEKKLPDAFLRRCVFHHITFPDAPTLERILVSRLARKDHSVDEGLIAAAVDLFSEMRDRLEDKKPATAELIAWVRILAREGVSGADLAGHYASDDTLEVLRRSIPVLAKTAPDREAALGFLDDLRIPPAQE